MPHHSDNSDTIMDDEDAFTILLLVDGGDDGMPALFRREGGRVSTSCLISSGTAKRSGERRDGWRGKE